MNEDLIGLNSIQDKFCKAFKFIIIGLLFYVLTSITLSIGLKYLSVWIVNLINIFGLGLLKFMISEKWVFK